MGYFKAEQSLREKERHNIWGTKIGLGQLNFISVLPVQDLEQNPSGSYLMYFSGRKAPNYFQESV